MSSIIAEDVEDCSVEPALSKGCHYVDKVTRRFVYVNHVRNLKKLHDLSCVMVTKIELLKVYNVLILSMILVLSASF